jgi:glutamate synthase domain-containing protein 3
MTEGIVVVLGAAGRNFGAGMSGGLSFVLDTQGDFPTRVNREFVTLERTSEAGEVDLLEALIKRHQDETGSLLAREILSDWPAAVASFWTVAPNSVAMEEGRAEIVSRQLEVLQDRISVADLRDAAPGPGQFKSENGRSSSGSLVEPPNAP